MKIYKIKEKSNSFYATKDENNFNLININQERLSEFKITDININKSDTVFRPISNPSKIVCVGLNYINHAKELKMAIPKTPIIFLKPTSAIITENDIINIPSISKQVDYEAELAIVIGKKCKNITPKQANEYIWGYTCFNDVTARDIQKKDGQWTRAKSFDTFAPIAPFIETEIENPNNLEIKTIVNNKVVQHGNTSDFIFKIEELVSFISSSMTLFPGDIISTGTPSGIGTLKSGDKVQIQIEKIGTLTNYVE